MTVGRYTLVALAALIVLSLTLEAAQFDAPYYNMPKKHAAAWAREAKQIDRKLAALASR